MEIFLTARLGASRLPRKHLRPVLLGRTSVDLLLERLRSTGLPVVGVIPTGSEDEPLAEAMRAGGAEIYRGDLENVLRRYRDALAARGGDRAIIVDGDDYFVSLTALRRLADHRGSEDVITCSGLPFGGAPYILSRAALDRLLALLGDDTSGWGYHLERLNGSRRTIADDRFTELERTYRFTLDYAEDLALLTRVYERTYRGLPITLRAATDEITGHLAEYRASFPELFDGTIDAKYRAHLGR